jgi:two-component system, LytTR family, sensor kinase
MVSLKKRSHFWYHLAFWVLSSGLWSGLFYVDFASVYTLAGFISSIIVAQILTSYLTVLVWIPRFLYRRQYLWFGLSYIGMLGLTGVVMGKVLAFIASTGTARRNNAYEDYTNEGIVAFYSLMLIIFANVMIASAKIAYDRFQTENVSKQLEKEKLELEKEKLTTELKFLKAQINPHFLFNSLNSIFNLISKNPEQAKELLLKFSEMLRYHLYETDVEKIPLEMELSYIRSYASMEKIRKGKNIDIHFAVQESVGYIEIVPLVLLTFVENAFKHVSHHLNKSNQVSIVLEKKAEWLCCTVINTKETLPRQTAGQPGGIGMMNVKRRLELVYPATHELLINEEQETYTVNLKLKINEN